MKLMSRLAAVCAALAMSLGIAGTEAYAAPKPAPIPVDARACRDEVPKQIRLVLGPGAVICYGGTVGSMYVDHIYAKGLAAGDYTGIAWCGEEGHQFYPGGFVRLECVVNAMEILPGDWN
ncbi:hypothetical protein GCM10012275_39330 [Longimycelium tulufanense]|uniref:Uncharacterized protein n=1 Tax=Longimycelium tulufanense TaxID=907463 RepID=A0A8J3CH01_9PSEU|nr:hypothetical protein GCM10012275_39330 [Longimycelium tulufanense]